MGSRNWSKQCLDVVINHVLRLNQRDQLHEEQLAVNLIFSDQILCNRKRAVCDD